MLFQVLLQNSPSGVLTSLKNSSLRCYWVGFGPVGQLETKMLRLMRVHGRCDYLDLHRPKNSMLQAATVFCSKFVGQARSFASSEALPQVCQHRRNGDGWLGCVRVGAARS